MRVGYDVVGNIAILKFDKSMNAKTKEKFASNYLKNNKSVRTVLEKTNKFSGRLRTLKTKYLAGEKTKEALYKENGCEFRFNVDTCYFSSRLSSERADIAKLVRKGENVLVMFGGIGVYAIIIAKNSKAKQVVSVELGRECSKYAEINVKRNKLQDRVQVVQGDVRRVISKKGIAGKSARFNERFDRIVMARPNLEDSFLDVAFSVIKKSGVIHYYGFYEESKIGDLRELIENEATKARRKIKIIGIKKAGDIGPYKFRYRVDLKVLN